MKWNHKMAPRWRHGWVVRLKRLLYPFLIRAKILWKFEDYCWLGFWDILNTKFSVMSFLAFHNTWLVFVFFLRYIKCGRLLFRWRHPIEITRNQKFVNEYIKITFSIQNLTMFPTSDQKSETTLPIALSLSYNILKFGRKLWNNNRDTGQRTLSCRFMFWTKVTCHRHNTQIWKILHCRL